LLDAVTWKADVVDTFNQAGGQLTLDDLILEMKIDFSDISTFFSRKSTDSNSRRVHENYLDIGIISLPYEQTMKLDVNSENLHYNFFSEQYSKVTVD
jgi:hypothetical protein